MRQVLVIQSVEFVWVDFLGIQSRRIDRASKMVAQTLPVDSTHSFPRGNILVRILSWVLGLMGGIQVDNHSVPNTSNELAYYFNQTLSASKSKSKLTYQIQSKIIIII